MVRPRGGIVALLQGLSGSVDTQPAASALPEAFKYSQLRSGSPGSTSLYCPPSFDCRLSRSTTHLLETAPPSVRPAYGELCEGPWQLAQWFVSVSNSGRTW